MVRLSPLGTPAELADLARAQGGCVSVAKARVAGVGEQAVHARIAAGRWNRHMGCLVVEQGLDRGLDRALSTSLNGGVRLAGDRPVDRPVDPHLLDAWAMTLRCKPGEAIVSGSTALHVAGKRPPRDLAPVRIARPDSPRRRRLPRVTILPQRAGDQSPRRLSDGLLCHRPLQAMIDIVQVVDPALAESWLNWALHERLLTAGDIRRALARVAPGAADRPLRRGTKGKHAATRLRLALAYVEGGTRSEAERALRTILRDHGIRGFQCDWPVSVRDGEPPFARLDCGHPAAKLAIEVDGRAFHSAHGAFERDRDRQGRLAECGWLTICFTWRMLTQDPTGVAKRVRAVLADRLPQPGAAKRAQTFASEAKT